MAGGIDTRYPNLYKCLTETNFWCSCPYTHLNISTLGKYRPCCSTTDLSYSILDTTLMQHFNSKEMFQLRKEMESDVDLGRVNTHCVKCLEGESKNVTSKRKRLNFKLLKDIRNNDNVEYLDSLERCLTRSLSNLPLDITEIKFRSFDLEFFGNKCNLHCVMCNKEKSSRFSGEIVNPFTSAQLTNSFTSELMQIIPNTKLLKFTGGELTINDDFLIFVDYLSRQSFSSTQDIEYVTNGTVFPDKLMSSLQRFRNAAVCISVDGYGVIDELQRRGSSFAVVDKNIDIYKKYFKKENLLLLSAITPLNCSRVEELYLYSVAKDMNINMSCAVMYPRHYCVSILPDEIRKTYLSRLYKSKHNSHFVSTLRFLEHGQYEEVYFKRYLDEIFSYYDSNLLLKYYPEYKPFI